MIAAVQPQRIVDMDGSAVEVFGLPTIKMFDGYLAVAFGVPHFHICIGGHRGPHNNPVSPELARHRRTARAELYRQLGRSGTPISWGIRLFNAD